MLQGRTVLVDLEPGGLRVDGRPVQAELLAVPGSGLQALRLNGAVHRVWATPRGGGVWDVHLRGRRIRAEVVDERTRAIRELAGVRAGPAGPRSLRAPMPGMVVKVEVAVGAEVEGGEALVVVEAMKMENELRAEAPGRVGAVHVAAGQAVEQGQVLVEFEEAGE